MRLLATGDWHLRGTNPRSRTDDYVATLKAKLLEVFGMAKQYDVKAIIVPGDIWDSFVVAISVLLDFAALIKDNCPCRILTTVGNHDVSGYNLATYWRSSARLLELLVPQMEVYMDPGKSVYFPNPEGQSGISITFTPYSSRIDREGYGYSPEVPEGYYESFYPRPKIIHVAHGMALDHIPPFDRYSLIQHIQTTADLVITGHDHTGYGVYRRADGKIFMNFGALPRIQASMNELERKIQVALIEVTDTIEITPIPLASAKPGPEVLDRTKIEAEKKRQYTMDNFAALIQQNTGQAILLDVNQIVETIAKQDNAAPEVVALALKKIDEMREKIA